jgi:hypothetical protein
MTKSAGKSFQATSGERLATMHTKRKKPPSRRSAAHATTRCSTATESQNTT